MHRNVTAIYRTREVAERVRQALEDIGVQARDIHVVPDPAYDAPTRGTAAPGEVAGVTGAGIAPTGTPAAGREHPLHHANPLEAGARDDRASSDRLYDLHLPDEDLRTYQHAVRQGDYVVSAEVEDDQVEKVQAVMRRPETEAYDIEHRATEFRDHDLIAHSAGDGRQTPSEEYRARRLTPGDEDRFARTYERSRRLDRF